MPMIEIKNMTKDYGQGRGVFDISISIDKGEVFGFVGTNGAGKTTTIGHLMGFLRPQSGSAEILGMDCWKDSAEIKKAVGYIPGEIAFPDAATGMEFLKRQAELLGLSDMSYNEIKHNEDKVYKIEFNSHEDYQRFLSEKFDFVNKKEGQNQVTISINDRNINTLTKTLKGYNLKFITEIKYTLDKYFKSLY